MVLNLIYNLSDSRLNAFLHIVDMMFLYDWEQGKIYCKRVRPDELRRTLKN